MSNIYLTEKRAVLSVAEAKKANRAENRKSTKRLLYPIILIAAGIALILIWQFKGGQSTKTKSSVTSATKKQAIALFNEGNFKKAIPKLQVYVAGHPNDVKSHSVLAQSYWLAGNTNAALSQYLEIVKIQPNDADTRYRLGILYGLLKENKKSINNLKAAARINPKLAVFRAELAKAYARSGKYGQAIKSWRRALDLTPAGNSLYRAGIYTEIGNIYLLKKDKANAKSAYEEGLKIDAGNKYLQSQLEKVK